jgi:hypothetical protein
VARFEASDVALLLPTRKQKVGAWVLCTAGVLLFAWSLAVDSFVLQPVSLIAAIVGLLTGLHLRTQRPPSRPVHHLMADSRGLWLDGRCAIAREDLRTGYVEPKAVARPLLHLVGKKRFERITLALHDAAEGALLLQALGLDKARSLAVFRVRAGIFSSKAAQSVLAASLMMLRFSYLWMRHLGPFWWVGFALVALVLLNAVWPTNVSVGRDGVLVGGLVRRSFYPFAKIASVQKTKWGVMLVRESGREVEVRTEAKENAKASPNRDALFECIQRRVAELATQRGETNAAVLLARGGRSVEEWTRGLHALGGGEVGGYRAPAIPTEEMWRILEDPTSDATARAGAAVALRASLDDEGRARVRAAAEESASPRVRVALEAAAGTADETELGRALADCEDEVLSQRGKAGA